MAVGRSLLCMSLLVLGSCSCAPPPPSPAIACERDSDCQQGHRCDHDGRCVVPDGGAAISDGGVSPRDGGLDAGLPFDAGGNTPDDRDDAGDASDLDSGPLSDGPGDDHDPDAGFLPDAGERDGGELDAGGFPQAPVLFALHPSVVPVGGVVVFEGSFPAGDYSVSFGGVELSLAVPAPVARLSVTVPANARSGQVQLGSGGDFTDVLPLRVTSFEPRLGPFSTALEQTLSARALPTTSEPLASTFAFSTGPWLYVIDPRSGADGIIERARVYADGTLGPFIAEAGFSSVPASGRAFVRAGGWLYAIGGDPAGSDLSSDLVERAAILADGTLGPFTSAGTLDTPRAHAQAVVVGRFLYVLGGRANEEISSALDSIARAPLLADGELGPFTAVASALTGPSDRASATVFGDSLYVVGGTYANGGIERASITADGDLGPFGAVSSSGFVGRRAQASLLLGDRLCVIGGQSGDTPIDSVQCAVVDVGGSLTFSDVGSLRVARGNVSGVAVVGNRLLVLGGEHRDLPGPLASEWAPIDLGAALTGLTRSVSGTLPALRHPACAVVEDRVVVSGGNPTAQSGLEPSANVYAAVVNDDGMLGPFSLVGSLSSARKRHRLAIIDDELWALGGVSGTIDADLHALDTIEKAPLSTLTFAPSSETLLSPRGSFYLFRTASDLYAAGGAVPSPNSEETSGDASTAVGCMNLDLTGTATTFSSCADLVNARTGPAGAVLGASVFVIGGAGSGGELTSVEQSELAPVFFPSQAALGLSLNSGRRDAMTGLLGNRLYVVGGREGDAAVLTSESVALGADGAPSGNFTVDTLALPEELSGGCLLVLKNRAHILAAVRGEDGVSVSYSGTLFTPP